ncbi:MAG: host-nuclease inhibitor Gam family protein [Deltaproteobacteria bacterium]|nr:host-nuclease inhibitor Gam family protein [Deltaproteobacteria bacterium]
MRKPLKPAPASIDSRSAISQADELLREISALTTRMEAVEAAAEAEIAAIHIKYADLARMQARWSDLDRDLNNLMRQRRQEIFAENEQVCRPYGRLFLGREIRVVIPREALSRIKSQGWLEAVRISESINRAVVEKWSGDRLQAIGACRREVIKFAYELVSGRHDRRNDESREVTIDEQRFLSIRQTCFSRMVHSAPGHELPGHDQIDFLAASP